jgi:uncharacterized protein (TIGR02145 family)
MNKTIFSLVVSFLFSLPFFGQASDESRALKKYALVIGNGNYSSSVLANPENDARAIAAALKNMGFSVSKYENLNQSQMKKAIDDFGQNLKGYDVGLFFYAGHGIQAYGYNYLIPVDAQLATERQIEYDCVQADRVLALMEGSGSKVNIIIMDACRNNPFERAWTRSSTGKGLAFMNAPGGTLIAYSTAPGTTALDGSGKNSPYTTALVESMNKPGLSITQVFQNITRLVSDKTNKQQIPWISSSLTGDFYLNPTITTSLADKTGQNEVQPVIGKKTTPNEVQPVIEKKTVQNEVQPVIENRAANPSAGSNMFLDPVENRYYKTVQIGNQVWMAENLNNTKLNDGTPILMINNQGSGQDLTSPGYCWYENKSEIGNTYGALYNWYAVNTGKLCPQGWHVPNDNEWTVLADYLGGRTASGGKLKENGTAHWKTPNTGSSNISGFSALPGGTGTNKGTFSSLGNSGYWWTSSGISSFNAWARYLYNYNDNIYRGYFNLKNVLSIRCIKD